MQAAIVEQLQSCRVADQPPNRKLMVQRRVVRIVLEQVDGHYPRSGFHFREEIDGVVDVFDHVERVGTVEAVGHLIAVQVVDRRPKSPPLEAPLQVAGARIVEVCECHPVAGLDQKQPVGADATAVVQKRGALRDLPGQRSQVRKLRPRHRERRQVVEVRLGGPVQGGLLFDLRPLSLQGLLPASQPVLVVAVSEICAKLVALPVGFEHELVTGSTFHPLPRLRHPLRALRSLCRPDATLPGWRS